MDRLKQLAVQECTMSHCSGLPANQVYKRNQDRSQHPAMSDPSMPDLVGLVSRNLTFLGNKSACRYGATCG